ncbi:MAG: peptide chain release factor N(5)-glutamine methyltransferase, partial [Silicimonas sp.]|nr:peptide chain release factor N(5)-glutamine methyltransferase [Silicimonas sp.]
MIRDEARAMLKAAGIADASTDARRLLEFAAQSGLDAEGLLTRRAQGTPVSHILGYRDFWKHRFKVTADVLDPRPDTETLVELALQKPFERVLDLGTGSGCILISLLAERPEASGVG